MRLMILMAVLLGSMNVFAGTCVARDSNDGHARAVCPGREGAGCFHMSMCRWIDNARPGRGGTCAAKNPNDGHARAICPGREGASCFHMDMCSWYPN